MYPTVEFVWTCAYVGQGENVMFVGKGVCVCLCVPMSTMPKVAQETAGPVKRGLCMNV